jgi:Ca-activated chloride channel family protein
MALLWPRALYLLGLIPLIVAAYIWVLRRKRRYALRYSSLALIRGAVPRSSRLRRHLPFALFLVALTSLTAALTRPVAIVSVPTGRATIILALDVSRSMCSTDVPPNRLKAAKAAALSFVRRQPAGTQIGIVAFAGYAELILPPTTDRKVLETAIEGLITGQWTAIGSAIIESVDAIAEIDPDVAPIVSGAGPGLQPTPVPRGAYAPSIVVLLTDGASNRGRLPRDAAQEAADRGVRVYTIGFGTEVGGRLDCGEPYLDDLRFGGGRGFGWGGGGGFRRGIDEETLKAVSDMTGGAYYSAESAGELQQVFQSLPTYLITRHETTEISVAFAALGALVAAVAVALSLIWHPLP